MRRKTVMLVATLCCFMLCTHLLSLAHSASSTILGWNNLGMHCMDSDYSVFSILPPYNTIEAQLLVGGKLVQSGSGYTLTYEAVADPDGSINSTTIGKGTWGQFASILYGLPGSATADNGLAGWNMPGAANSPQQMKFENFNSPATGVSTSVNWFRAEGIPITPYDDKGNKNPYPLMRIVARDATNAVIASSNIVLPVSDEMDCSSCHGSGTQSAAKPAAGWVNVANKDRDYRLNILRLHDERQAAQTPALYRDALAAKGYAATGLYDTAIGGKPILCAGCHSSEALGTASFSSSNGSVPPLTSSVHTKHATVQDPVANLALNDSNNRSACYRCHPGSATKCLRGAMGSAVAPDGSLAMQCQSCHGSMSQVGSPSRTGWFMEPVCQSCHTGTASKNSGQIRYTDAFDANGLPRAAADQTFATSPNTPASGLSLYRFSVGHGGLQCSACHGSTHAEFPSAERNDNIRNVDLQGHAGVTVECTSCHTTMPTSANGGPHGMHPIGQAWVNGHHDSISSVGVASCKACHGTDSRGTVLSKVQTSRSFQVKGTTLTFYRGATIGCYTCHNGPSNDNLNTAAAPVVSNVTAQTTSGTPVTIAIPVTGTGAVARIITKPSNGTVGVNNNIATFVPYDDFAGTDTFTFAAYDGAKNSTVATGTVIVTPKPPVITVNPTNQSVLVGSVVNLTVAATGTGPLSYQWYKNGSAVSGATNASLSLAAAASADAGTYYAVVTNAGGSSTSATATITVIYPAPTISSFTPGFGPVGASIIINGTNFSTAQTVGFNGVSAAFTVGSNTQITAVVPIGATTGTLTVKTLGGKATSSTAFTVMQLPTITGLTPSSGAVGTGVTITGTNFTGATKVTFNGVIAPFAVVSNTTIITSVPSGASTGRISVVTPSGTATSGTFTVFTGSVAPRISGFSPASGPVGTVITVTGSNFGGLTAAAVGGVTAPFIISSNSRLTVTVPAGAATGRITLTTAGGTRNSQNLFTVTP